jgi:hypothetical protein
LCASELPRIVETSVPPPNANASTPFSAFADTTLSVASTLTVLPACPASIRKPWPALP